LNRPHAPRAAPGHARHHQLHRPPAARPLPVGLRPLRWQRWAVHASTLALAATGIAWLLAHQFMRSTGAFGEELPSPIEPWALRLHGIVAYLFLLVLGSMGTVHIVFAWKLRRSLWTGSALVAACLVPLATGLALYYAPEGWHGAASLAHWAVGLTLLPVLWLHVRAARRSRRQPAPSHVTAG
jgi:hypothetical protein